MTLEKAPVVNTQMLIRRPVADVFEAFVNPAITTRFWFTKSSGRVEPGARLTWEWEMYGASTPVQVQDVQPNERIRIEWNDAPLPVEWRFSPHGERATLVSISTSGFRGTDDEILAQAIDSMGGFTMVLAAAKALLEHDIELNLVRDAHP